MRKSKRKGREAFEEHSYWQSYSDMMAALLLIFILIIAITLAIYKQKTTDLDHAREELALSQESLSAAREDLEEYKAAIEKSNEELAASLAQLQQAYANEALTQDELNKAYLEIENARNELSATRQELENIVGIRTDIIGALQSAFNNSSMSVDAQTGSITFSADVLFPNNSAELSEDSKKTLREIIPMYLDVLLQDNFRDYIAEIIIEGHTDTNGSYQWNMELSSKRAYSVADFCLDSRNGLSEEKIEQLTGLLTVNGRSYSRPVYQHNSQEINMEGSRRVEIKFRLKEDEMIEKIAEVLGQQE